MGNYRMRDVPRGKRWAHFWRYYKLHVLAALIAAVLLGNVIYASFLKPKADVFLLWLSDQYSLTCEQALLEKLEMLPDWDLNGDGTVRVRLNHVDFSAPFDELGLPVQSELLTIYSAEESCIYLLSDYAVEWMAENDLLGQWRDLGLEGEGIFALRAGELPFFQEEALAPLADTMLSIAKPGQQSGPVYDAQMDALRALLAGEPGLAQS